jgi:hypothetical protein
MPRHPSPCEARPKHSDLVTLNAQDGLGGPRQPRASDIDS